MNRKHLLDMYEMMTLNLQMFAEANTQTTESEGLSDEMKIYYEKRLIDYAEPNLVHDQFADKYPIPQNGGKTIEFRKYDSLDKVDTPLQEGVTPDGDSLHESAITSTVEQFGNYITISDMLRMTAIDNNVLQALKVLGSQAGRSLDSITRDVMAGGTNVIRAGGRLSRKLLESTDTLKPIYFFQAAAQLEAMNAPKIEGSYVAIIHPYTAFDIMTSPEWIDVHKYADPEAIFNGEIGKLGNVRFVQSTEAKIWKDATCPNDVKLTYATGKTFADVYRKNRQQCTSDDDVISAVAGGKPIYDASGNAIANTDGTPAVVKWTGSASAVFGTIVLGANAYGTTEIEGGGLQTIVKQLGAGDDPLNQRSTVGWKATKTAERLIEQYMIRLESVSSYSELAAAN
jgi:N4-gp56 family major capsid protein